MTASSDRDRVPPAVPASAVDNFLGAVGYALNQVNVDGRDRMLCDSITRVLSSIRSGGQLDDIRLTAAALYLRDVVDEPVLVAS